MPIRPIADRYNVSPQITPDELPDFQAAGITTVICNRPDDENPPPLRMAAMKEAVEAAGMRFVALPFNQMTLTQDIVAAQRDALEQSDGPVLAYCASGNRSTIVWALGQAELGVQGADALIAAGAKAGYDLNGLRPTLTALVQKASTQA